MTRVVIADVSEETSRDLTIERSILGPDVDVVRTTGVSDEASVVSACRDADVILTDLAPVTKRVIAELDKCRLISIAGTGYSNIDVEAAQDADIRVCAITEYCTDEVADHVTLLMLALCRRLDTYRRQVQDDRSWLFRANQDLKRLRGLTLGIIGLGRIGRAVAERARGFGMTLLAHDRHPGEDAAITLGIRFCDLATLLGESDVISLNCSMSAGNEKLIDADAFARMSRRPVFINCARGELVDETALIQALDSGQIRAAGLDVLDGEPPDLERSSLVGRDNVLLTPHIAFYSEASLVESRKISTRNVRHFIDGDHHLVDRYVGLRNRGS